MENRAKYYSINEIAEILGLHRCTVRKITGKLCLPCRIGKFNRLMYSEESIQKIADWEKQITKEKERCKTKSYVPTEQDLLAKEIRVGHHEYWRRTYDKACTEYRKTGSTTIRLIDRPTYNVYRQSLVDFRNGLLEEKPEAPIGTIEPALPVLTAKSIVARTVLANMDMVDRGMSEAIQFAIDKVAFAYDGTSISRNVCEAKMHIFEKPKQELTLAEYTFLHSGDETVNSIAKRFGVSGFAVMNAYEKIFERFGFY